jgi:hypothetical protein
MNPGGVWLKGFLRLWSYPDAFGADLVENGTALETKCVGTFVVAGRKDISSTSLAGSHLHYVFHLSVLLLKLVVSAGWHH